MTYNDDIVDGSDEPDKPVKPVYQGKVTKTLFTSSHSENEDIVDGSDHPNYSHRIRYSIAVIPKLGR